jgi:hypothetical protein
MIPVDKSKTFIWWRHWRVAIILAVLAGFVIWAMLNLGPWIKAWQNRQAADAVNKQMQGTYLNDRYGGTSPQETFDLFISALEKGDVGLASKYFTTDKQESWQKTLEEYQSKGLLDDLALELKNTETTWQDGGVNQPGIKEFHYSFAVKKNSVASLNGQDVPVKTSIHSSTIIFQKYPSGLWKISFL